MDLTVCAVNWYSVEYLRFLAFTLRLLADRPTFRWLVCNTEADDHRTPELAALGNAQVIYRNLDNLPSSVTHGAGLNALIPLIQTDHVLFVDPDSAVLASGWDSICRRELADQAVAAIGAPYDGFMSKRRFDDFPAIFFLYCRTDLVHRRALDMRPHWAIRSGSVRRKLRQYLGLFDSDRDTGWQVRRAALEEGLRGTCFRWLNGSSRDAVVLRNGTPGDEYHWQGRPIFSHQGRSNTRAPFRGAASVRWFCAICRYLRQDAVEVSERLELGVNFAADPERDASR